MEKKEIFQDLSRLLDEIDQLPLLLDTDHLDDVRVDQT